MTTQNAKLQKTYIFPRIFAFYSLIFYLLLLCHFALLFFHFAFWKDLELTYARY